MSNFSRCKGKRELSPIACYDRPQDTRAVNQVQECLVAQLYEENHHTASGKEINHTGQ